MSRNWFLILYPQSLPEPSSLLLLKTLHWMNYEISKAFSAIRSSNYEILSLGTGFAQTKLFLPIISSTFRKGSAYSSNAISIIQKFQGPSCQRENSQCGMMIKWNTLANRSIFLIKKCAIFYPTNSKTIITKLSSEDMSHICLCQIKTVKFKPIKLIKYIQFILS